MIDRQPSKPGQEQLFGLSLHTPKEDPGSCYITMEPNRRPTSFWNNGCFAAGTQIRLADNTTKSVERIEEGDQIYNPVTRTSATVKRTIAGPEVEPLLRITTKTSSVVVSSKHPFQTDSLLKTAKTLTIDDRILTSGGRWEPVVAITIEKSETPPQVYNFALESNSPHNWDHMVEANGVVTGDLFLQEKAAGLDPTKRPTHVPTMPYKQMMTELMRKAPDQP